MGDKRFQAAMYLRLSRDDSDVGEASDRDGQVKSESDSIGNQRELIKDFLRGQPDMELYDVYVDDGFSGSSFDRPEFKRMIRDIEAGKVNLVIVKDLSRFGRDYIESGRYLQKVFPALSVRFIALTDHYDSFRVDAGESGIVLPIKNFINDSYCRDISMKVKSQLEAKRKSGECVAAFAPYGYRKAEYDKNRLVVDSTAAEIVRKIFLWKMEGMANSAIAEKLNGLGILSPREYKRSVGINYKGGFSGALKSGWSSSTVKRILTNEMYLGHLVQGKTEKISYKLDKIVAKPKEAWIRVENTHEAILPEEHFQIVRNLLKADGRVSPTSGRPGFFTGLLFCGDCGEQMIRRVNRYKDTQRVYYICSTKNRGEGCTRHSVAEESLRELTVEVIRKYANCFLEETRIRAKARGMEINSGPIACCDAELARLKEAQRRYDALCDGLAEDLERGIITGEEYERLYGEFRRKAAEQEEAQEKQTLMKKELSESSAVSESRLKAMRDCAKLGEIDRGTLCSMVKRISVFENKRTEIEFYFTDSYRMTRKGAHEDGQSLQKRLCPEGGRPAGRNTM